MQPALLELDRRAMAQAKQPNSPLGTWIVQAMESRGWKQADLVRESGLGQSTVSSYISGKRRPHEIEDLRPLVEALYMGDRNDRVAYLHFEDSAIRATWPTSSSSPFTREIDFDNPDFEAGAYTGQVTQEQVDATKAKIQERANVRENAATYGAKGAAAAVLRFYLKSRGDGATLQDIPHFYDTRDAQLPYFAFAEIKYADDAVGNEAFRLNLDTGDVVKEED